MNTKDFLKTELDKIDKNAYYEIDGYGNIEFICKVMELYAVSNLAYDFCDHLNTYDGMEEIRFDFMIQDFIDKSQ